MKKVTFTFMAVALLAVCMMATTAWAQGQYGLASGAFGSPDPTTGSMVMGWFDIDKNGTDNVLPVIVNMSTMDLGSSSSSSYRVHIIIWDVNSNHVWDKNLQLSPWDVWADASIRDIVENTIGDGMASAQRAQITETVTIDGVEVERYRGYWTATVVWIPVGTAKPYQLNYPHAYVNVLGGWVYVVDLLDGRTDGYAMVSVETAELWANSQELAFMLSFSADFWNRPWWWAGFDVNNDIGPYYSWLWDCSQDEFFSDEEFVYERFDASACPQRVAVDHGKGRDQPDDTLAGPQSFLRTNCPTMAVKALSTRIGAA